MTPKELEKALEQAKKAILANSHRATPRCKLLDVKACCDCGAVENFKIESAEFWRLIQSAAPAPSTPQPAAASGPRCPNKSCGSSRIGITKSVSWGCVNVVACPDCKMQWACSGLYELAQFFPQAEQRPEPQGVKEQARKLAEEIRKIGRDTAWLAPPDRSARSAQWFQEQTEAIILKHLSAEPQGDVMGERRVPLPYWQCPNNSTHILESRPRHSMKWEHLYCKSCPDTKADFGVAPCPLPSPPADKAAQPEGK